MQKWYKAINKGQKVFLFLVAIVLIMAYGIGLLPLAVLVYLELGERFRDVKNV